ncbi:MAG: phosphoribosylformylglycinamidine synthase subunit PurQ, partial [Clostridia bacterium]|nr:phosphoribosylformylglycinamidine synthase subunit PurQ [Clostridia bacterium]
MSSSPFTGAIYSIVLSISKLVASGVPVESIRLSLQEFFKKLGKDPVRWGEPLSALLGAMYAQINLGVGAIGGKDSMSGSFEHIDVPPTLISFAMGITKADKLISNTFEENAARRIYRIALPRDSHGIPIFARVLKLYKSLYKAIQCGDVVACNVVEEGGAVCAVIKSCMGNMLGTTWKEIKEDMFNPSFGDFVVLTKDVSKLRSFKPEYICKLNGTHSFVVGKDNDDSVKIKMSDLSRAFTSPMEEVFPSTSYSDGEVRNLICCAIKRKSSHSGLVKPRVLIPVFPGTNCEYDTARAFERAGAVAQTLIIKNQSPSDIEDSVKALIKALENSQILAFPGGFSGGDEPDGSGKFI